MSDLEKELTAVELGGADAEVDLHGQRSEEAVEHLERAIQAAFMGRARSLRVIHGRGDGRLRETVHLTLREHPNVESFRDSSIPSETGGVTYLIIERK